MDFRKKTGSRRPEGSSVNTTDVQELFARFEDPDAPPMWVFDQETLAFLAVNPSAIRGYGYSAKEFAAMTILDIRPAEDITALVRETLDPAHRGSSQKEKWRHKTKDGSVFAVEITSWELTFKGRKSELVQAIPIIEAECETIHGTTQSLPLSEHEEHQS